MVMQQSPYRPVATHYGGFPKGRRRILTAFLAASVTTSATDFANADRMA